MTQKYLCLLQRAQRAERRDMHMYHRKWNIGLTKIFLSEENTCKYWFFLLEYFITVMLVGTWKITTNYFPNKLPKTPVVFFPPSLLFLNYTKILWLQNRKARKEWGNSPAVLDFWRTSPTAYFLYFYIL